MLVCLKYRLIRMGNISVLGQGSAGTSSFHLRQLAGSARPAQVAA